MSKKNTKTILVIDDEEVIRNLMNRIIEKNKYKSIIGASALEALLAVRRFNPHLIVSDFNLPKYSDGVDLATSICQSKKKKIPVIIMSGQSENEKKARDRNFEYIQKPFNLMEMASLIKKYWGLRKLKSFYRYERTMAE